jgi:hypothetical protein
MVDDLLLDKHCNFVSGTWFCPNGHANQIVVRTRIIWVGLIVGFTFILIGSPFAIFMLLKGGSLANFEWPAGFFFLGTAIVTASIVWSVVAYVLGQRRQ